jgi:hypothetical protein
MGGTRRFHVLADQEDIDRAQIEFVKEREGREAFFGRMHASIKLHWEYISEQSEIKNIQFTYHDRLALVLDDMT